MISRTGGRKPGCYQISLPIDRPWRPLRVGVFEGVIALISDLSDSLPSLDGIAAVAISRLGATRSAIANVTSSISLTDLLRFSILAITGRETDQPTERHRNLRPF